MRAFVRSPFVSALAGGTVVAVALLAFGAVGRDRPTTIIEQTGMGGGTTTAESAMTAHAIYERDAPGVVFVRADDASPGATISSLHDSEASGTGFVIDRDGHVLTNQHLVGDARTVRVSFDDDETVTARVLGADAANDLALLKVDPAEVELHPLVLGDSTTARVGDPVIAIGNPFGLARTLTTGVVSALQRQLTAPNGFTIQHVIQTDAPINPGSSGGPLLDAEGRVIGITSQVATDREGGSTGIGFAVPIDTAKSKLDELKRTGSVVHAYLGIRGTTIGAELSAAMPSKIRRGVLVQVVLDGSPAERAGLRGGSIESQVDGVSVLMGGDVLTSIDGRTLTSMEQLTGEIADRRAGDEIRLGVLRDGEAMQLSMRLGTQPRSAPDAAETP
ncbi:S1C family serine protease [Conexibacter arvalis]|uniref:S1-C subfamily serine protease n=1 Tax=Conexibacter arvalis TaxID=912552 RepID=A0A840IJ64_9ACTN|nr:trypsin-like peptidase domain-containing protein [Conexibacter arvalis]MBB4663980.1 S1-C subfamily serine protease [Conexibacter arvalis]